MGGQVKKQKTTQKRPRKYREPDHPRSKPHREMEIETQEGYLLLSNHTENENHTLAKRENKYHIGGK